MFSTQLSRRTIGQHSAYDSTKSRTFRNQTGSTFLITYGDGSGAAGIVGIDTVDIGGATVTEQAIEMATAISQSFIQDANNDGLVGLAFGRLNTGKRVPGSDLGAIHLTCPSSQTSKGQDFLRELDAEPGHARFHCRPN